VFPYMFPRDFGQLFRYAINRAPQVRYQWSDLPVFLPWLVRYFLASSPERALQSAMAELPLIRRSLIEHEALIAEAKRNATVTMTTDGVLMRLNKADFRELMNAPLLQWVSPEEARAIIARGGRWLDVRLPSEHQTLTIEGALNVPLYLIRLKLATLDRNTPYIVYCDTGRRSSAAAYILVERGFDAYVLTGGVSSNDGLQLVRGGSADKP